MAQLEDDPSGVFLDPRRRALLAYAHKLTRAPNEVGENDLQDLRSVGLSDRDILELCEVTAYYAYVNRIADGLGVALESTTP